MSDFTPFVWRDPAPGNRVANLVPVTGFTVGRHGRVKLAIQTRSISICLVKLEGVEKYRTRKPPHMYHSTILPTEACRGALSFFLVNVSVSWSDIRLNLDLLSAIRQLGHRYGYHGEGGSHAGHIRSKTPTLASLCSSEC